MEYRKLKIAAVTSMVWAASIALAWCLTACAGKPVKWWFNDAKDAKEFVRKHDHAPTEHLGYLDADGYLCLSPVDAEYAEYAIRQLKDQ